MTAGSQTRRSRLARARYGILALTVLSCDPQEGGVEAIFVLTTPHEVYEANLEKAGLHETALGRDWIDVAERSLADPAVVRTPYREVRYLDPTRAVAVAYRVRMERGQRLSTQVEAVGQSEEVRLFLDLFYETESTGSLDLVRSADTTSWEIDYVARRPGFYLMRIQPELLRGGRFTVTVSLHASLDFPVAEHDLGSVRSGFGARRDGGQREHHGVDIFASRGTAVLASVAGRARPSTNGLGGKVVWLRDSANGRTLYYAHLDQWAFDASRLVEAGDTIGFVGNTGNARTTPPHLHFGVYMRGVGAVNPHPQLYEPTDQPQDFRGQLGWVGQNARTGPLSTTVRDEPSRHGRAVAVIPRHTSLELLAGSGNWYRVRLPDHREGYVLGSATVSSDQPTEIMTAAEDMRILDAPASIAASRDTVVIGQTLPILGIYGEYALVENGNGVRGWVRYSSLEPATEVTSTNN